jgi:hypothetical protein
VETDVAVDHNDRALRQMLKNIYLDVKDLMEVDYDQVPWEVIGEISQVANTILNIINPEIEE